MFLYKFLQILIWPFYRLFHPIKVVGIKNIPKGKAILLCNHHSNSDVATLGTAIFRKQYFLAKKELFKNKLFGAIIKHLGAIPIDRQNVDLNAIKICINLLKKGKLLTIFPEGTRNTTSDALLEIKNGAGMIALKSGAPIIPMWLEKKPKAFTRNKLTIGKPISVEEYQGRKLGSGVLDELGEKITTSMLKLKE